MNLLWPSLKSQIRPVKVAFIPEKICPSACPPVTSFRVRQIHHPRQRLVAAIAPTSRPPKPASSWTPVFPRANPPAPGQHRPHAGKSLRHSHHARTLRPHCRACSASPTNFTSRFIAIATRRTAPSGHSRKNGARKPTSRWKPRTLSNRKSTGGCLRPARVLRSAT